MTTKRFIRDFAVLLVFCGAFYFLTVMMSGLDKEAPSNSDFSDTRKRADASMRSRDWTSASADFMALTEKDPYNGHAWYRGASGFNAQRNDLLQMIRDARDEPATPGAPRPSTEESEALLDELKADLDRLSEQAKRAYKKAKEFARYRADSLLNLAAIESYEGDYTESLDFLEEFVGHGNYTARGLERYRVFGFTESGFDVEDDVRARLHNVPRFWDIVRKERSNQSR